MRSESKLMPILFALAVALYLATLLVRFLWVRFDLAKLGAEKEQRNSTALLNAIGGVHGTITLAMAFSLPLTAFGKALPYRNAIIFVAAVVIILSLVVPTVILPLLLPKKENILSDEEVTLHRNQMVDYASQQLIASSPKDDAQIATVLETLLSQKGSSGRVNRKKLQEIFNQTNQITTDVALKMARDGEIDPNTAQTYLRLSQFHSRFTQGSRFKQFLRRGSFVLLRLRGKRKVGRQRNQPRKSDFKSRSFDQRTVKLQKMREDMVKIENKIYEQVMTYLKDAANTDNSAEISVVRHSYNEHHSRYRADQADQEREQELFLQAFQYEYNYVQTSVQSGRISKKLGNELYQQISTDELAYMQNVAN